MPLDTNFDNSKKNYELLKNIVWKNGKKIKFAWYNLDMEVGKRLRR